MSFHVPYDYDSSPAPSTPDKRSNIFGTYSTMSTTPSAPPPPSSAASFTPMGDPPPSSVFGESINDTKPVSQPFGGFKFNSGSKNLFQGFKSVNSAPASSPPAAPPLFGARTGKSGLSQQYKPSHAAHDNDDDEEEDGDYEDYDDAEDEDDDDRMDDEDNYMDEMPLTQSLMRASRNTDVGFGNSLRDDQPLGKQSTYGLIAKEMHTQLGNAELTESADLILDTEDTILRLYEGLGEAESLERTKRALSVVPSQLMELWESYVDATATHQSGEYTTTIGPGPDASDFANANFLASLLLPLYQPPAADLSHNRSGMFTQSTALILRDSRLRSVPEVLLDWMDVHHNPYPSQLENLRAHTPSPASSRLFWDILFNSLLRGRVEDVIGLLKNAGWQHAKLSLDEAADSDHGEGYSGETLAVVEKVVAEAINILSNSPQLQNNWDVGSSEWVLFRLRIKGARENLRIFAEGRDNKETSSVPFAAENFGINTGGQTFSQRAKKAGSKVPWTIYQNLLTLYGMLMGDRDAIISSAQDWIEATIGLLVWGSEMKDQRSSTYATENGTSPYLRDMEWLGQCFRRATANGSDFEINTLNPIEVGLAATFEGEVEHVIGFLRAWSGPVSSAVAEIASLGGWLPTSEPQNLITMDGMGLDEEDMELLGVTAPSDKVDGVKDRTLIAYAQLLQGVGTLQSRGPGNKTSREGWELAIEVLGRLDSAPRSEEVVGELLQNVRLDSSSAVDKSWKILTGLAMMNLAEKTAEDYADQVAEDTHKYGEALWYYALAHKTDKVREVLNLLISFSLIHSTAFPAEADMDEHLRRLVLSPQETLVELSSMDYEAAKLLHKMLSGYGTLRKFYELRDTESNGRSLETRKLQAVSALIAVITSSDDNIRGGLYDESRDAVVSVDFLLALLGEALVFVNQPVPLLSTVQINLLLKSVEDLQAVSSRIFNDTAEFFDTVLASTPGLKGSTPHDLLKKSTSSLSGTSSFSMVNSSMFASQLQRSMGSSGVLVKKDIKRGWDWRKGITAGTAGEDVLRMLRLGLAKDLGRVWLLEADGQL